MSDIEFIPGLICKAPNEKAPEFVKLRLSIKRQELLDWLEIQTGEWINADVKESRGGKMYCAVDNWKPQQGGAQRQEPPKSTGGSVADDFDDSSIPF